MPVEQGARTPAGPCQPLQPARSPPRAFGPSPTVPTVKHVEMHPRAPPADQPARLLTALDRQPCSSTLRLGPQCCTSREAAFTTIQFHVLLTLSSKFFSNFHHCTCLLSVLGLYLALRGVYLALWAALTSYLTRRRGQQSQTTALRAYHPLWAVATVKLDFDWCLMLWKTLLNTTFRTTCMAGSSVLGFSRFIRHYSGNHSCFLFLRLLICLNSAGSPP